MSDSIKVAVRIRPLVESEKDRGCKVCLDVLEENPQIVVQGGPSFTYNYVFNSESTQQDIYDGAVRSLVEKLFKGYNVTILAYGQTGSGKTHTMGSNCVGEISESEQGIIFRAVQQIFTHIKNNDNWSYKISASFMELYKEQLYDLLAVTRSTVDIREDCKRICIPDLTEISVGSASAAIKCLQDGSIGRVTGATAMNQHSSRSHAIFTLTVQQQQGNDPNTAMTAKFHLVDLAGSERCKKTQAEGDRLQEGVKINHGLLALGNVISTLGEGGKRVPSYRDSKLTRLLQDSLGGNSYTLMIACISPADYNLSETLSTLRYADRARRIKNKPIVNQDPKGAEIAALKKKVEELQLQILESGTIGNVDPAIVEELTQQLKLSEAKYRTLNQRYNENLLEIAVMEEKLLFAETARERMNDKILKMNEDFLQRLADVRTGLNDDEARKRIETLKESFCENLMAMQQEQKRTEEEQRWPIMEEEVKFGNSSMEEYTENLKALDFHQEEHANKQCALKRELRELQQEIALKTETFEQFSKTSNIYEATLKGSLAMQQQYEKQIAGLERENADLAANILKLQNANKQSEATIKQSELAKKKAQIEVLQKKLAEHLRVVREKEAAEKRVGSLQTEITNMKQAKVRLIRQMKQESDNWKTWRLEREREAQRLRQQDRKRQMEIVKLQTMHNKQQHVNKRKLEEAVFANKRLKEALDRAWNKPQHEGKGTKDKIEDLIKKEVDLIVGSIDGKHVLNELLNYRTNLQQEIAALRRCTIDSVSAKKLAALTEELELRSTQIADFQQKLLDVDQEQGKKSRWESLNTMNDFKTALNQLMLMVATMKKDRLEKENSEQEALIAKEAEKQKSQEEAKALSKRVECLTSENQKLREELDRQLIETEKRHQEALEAIVKTSNTNEIGEIIEIQEKELIEKSLECEGLKNKLETIIAITGTPKNKRKKCREFEDLNITPSGEYTDDDDLRVDPDWKKTPLYRRLKEMRKTSIIPQRKRSGDGSYRCGCHTKCDTKRCYCTKHNVTCGENCSCSPTKCMHKLQLSKPSPLNDSFSENVTATVDHEHSHSMSKRRKTTFKLFDDEV